MRRIALALVLVAGCSAAGPDVPGGTGPQQDPPGPERLYEVAVRFHMYRSYDLSRAIERMLVRGALTDARALAASIASSSEPPALEAWGRQAAVVRERATQLADAPGIDEACRRAARLAEACAACHVAAGARPLFDEAATAPPDQPTLEARMARHRWAVDRLWQGMIGDADRAWRAGLDVLAATPLPFPATAGDRGGLADLLQQHAVRARERPGTTLADRGQIYGELLVTCAACHSGRATTPR